jgi:hypothetical protein
MRIDFQFAQNAPATFLLEFTDSNGQAIDFTGSTFKIQVKARDASDAPTGSSLLTLTTGSGIDGDLAEGEVQPTFPKESLSGLPAGEYIYDCLRLESSVVKERLFWGLIDVASGVTS